jgi:uncharacterized protein (DUF2164 family)
MNIPLSKDQKADVIESIRRFAAEELDLEMSEIRAGLLLEYFLEEIAPLAYNQGVEDARSHLARLAEDLPGTCFEEPLRYWAAQEGPRGVRRKPEK